MASRCALLFLVLIPGIDVWAGPNVKMLKCIFFNNYKAFLFYICCGYVVCYFTIETSAFTHNFTGLTVTISRRKIFEFRVHKWYMKVLIYLFTDRPLMQIDMHRNH